MSSFRRPLRLAPPSRVLGLCVALSSSLLMALAAPASAEPVAREADAGAPLGGERVRSVQSTERLAELWLQLAEEARLGLPSSLFSQVAASGSGGTGGSRIPRNGDPASGAATPTGRDVVVPAAAGSRTAIPAATGQEVEVVLEPGREEADAERLAGESGLEVTRTRRADDGSLVATVRAPDGVAPDAAQKAVEELERAPGVVETRALRGQPGESEATADASAPDPDVTGIEGGEELTDGDRLVQELLGEDAAAPPSELDDAGFPWRFALGMLASLGMLTVAAALLWSTREGG